MWMRAVAVLLLSTTMGSCARAPLTPVRFAGLTAPPGAPFRLDHQVQVLHLDNGLTVALLPDDRTNLVNVDMRYAVGAAEDPAGLGTLVELEALVRRDLREDRMVVLLSAPDAAVDAMLEAAKIDRAKALILEKD